MEQPQGRWAALLTLQRAGASSDYRCPEGELGTQCPSFGSFLPEPACPPSPLLVHVLLFAVALFKAHALLGVLSNNSTLSNPSLC